MSETDTIRLQSELAAAERECAALRELAERLIEDVDGLEFYHYAKEEYSRWLDMRHENGCDGPVVIKPGLGDALLARLRAVEYELDMLRSTPAVMDSTEG